MSEAHTADELFPSLFSKRVIVVTGGAGFVGSHVCKKLIELSNSLYPRRPKIISIDNYFTGERHRGITGVDYIECETENIDFLYNADLIIHLGEYSRVEKSLTEPDVVLKYNTAGMLGILKFWKRTGAKLVYAGSSTRFADDGKAIHETPYAWTKYSNAMLLQNYASWVKTNEDRDLDHGICYLYNAYGPGERDSSNYGTVVETFIRQYLEGKPFTVVYPGTQARHFTHVDDIVNGILHVADRGSGDGFHIGNKQRYSVIELAKLFSGIGKVWKSSKIEYLPERPGNRGVGLFLDKAVIPDTHKTEELGWQAKHSLVNYLKSRCNPDLFSDADKRQTATGS